MPTRGRNRVLDFRCFFITTTCRNWLHLLKSNETKEICYQSIEFCCKKYDASVVAYVLMSNHLHLILFFEGENHLSAFMRDFKKFTSVKIRQWLEQNDGASFSAIRSVKAGRSFQVWKDRFDDVHLNRRAVLKTKIDYIHNNPVEADLCNSAEGYSDSSGRFYLLQQQVRLPISHYFEL